MPLPVPETWHPIARPAPFEPEVPSTHPLPTEMFAAYVANEGLRGLAQGLAAEQNNIGRSRGDWAVQPRPTAALDVSVLSSGDCPIHERLRDAYVKLIDGRGKLSELHKDKLVIAFEFILVDEDGREETPGKTEFAHTANGLAGVAGTPNRRNNILLMPIAPVGWHRSSRDYGGLVLKFAREQHEVTPRLHCDTSFGEFPLGRLTHLVEDTWVSLVVG